MEKLKEIIYVGLGLAQETKEKLQEQYDKYLAKGKREDGLDVVEDIFGKIRDTGDGVKEKVENRINIFLDLLTSKK